MLVPRKRSGVKIRSALIYEEKRERRLRTTDYKTTDFGGRISTKGNEEHGGALLPVRSANGIDKVGDKVNSPSPNPLPKEREHGQPFWA